MPNARISILVTAALLLLWFGITPALASYHQALSAARAAGDAEWEARALNNLGGLYAVSDRDTAAKFLEGKVDTTLNIEDHYIEEGYPC